MHRTYDELKEDVYSILGVAAESMLELLDETYAAGYDEGRDKGYSDGYDGFIQGGIEYE